MEEMKYPFLEEHKTLHFNIIEKINTFVKQLPTMDESLFEKELAKIIDIALVHHIIQEDRKIISWSKSNTQA
jgi:hemerythrin